MSKRTGLDAKLEAIRKKNDPKRPHMFKGPGHVCGLTGYGHSPYDYCEGCDDSPCAVCGKVYDHGKHVRQGDEAMQLLVNENADLRELCGMKRKVSK